MASINAPALPGYRRPTLVQDFAVGFDIGTRYRDRKNRGELAEALASAPEPDSSPAIPADTEQTQQLREQTVDFAESEGGIPESEKETLASTQTRKKTKRLTTADWAAWRKDVMDKAAQTGDPDAVRKASQHVTNTQHEGFMRNADMAHAYLQAGDMDRAATYMENAYEFFPDGGEARFTIDAENQRIIAQSFQEETGQPMGVMYFDRKNMPKFLENLRDPTKFAYFNWEDKYRAGQETRAIAEEARKQGTYDYGVTQRPQDEAMQKAELALKKAQAYNYQATAQFQQRRSGTGGSSGEFSQNQKLDKLVKLRGQLNELQTVMGQLDPKRDKELYDGYKTALEDTRALLKQVEATPVTAGRRPSALPTGGGPATAPESKIPPGSKFSQKTGYYYTLDGRVLDKDGELMGRYNR